MQIPEKNNTTQTKKKKQEKKKIPEIPFFPLLSWYDSDGVTITCCSKSSEISYLFLLENKNFLESRTEIEKMTYQVLSSIEDVFQSLFMSWNFLVLEDWDIYILKGREKEESHLTVWATDEI